MTRHPLTNIITTQPFQLVSLYLYLVLTFVLIVQVYVDSHTPLFMAFTVHIHYRDFFKNSRRY